MLKPKRKCHCWSCRNSKHLTSLAAKATPKERKVLNELFSRWEHAEGDAEYYQCIVNGSWPNADKIIKSYRDKVTYPKDKDE